ncbi:polysaccharide biosynthesis/export family protein [Pelagicoccus albus]|uniref:Polysaccharide biosynthesis/export family protein n=1 Tax=Pelagicoccus albus TaxID=415222 RepID=A0A7X1B612_9BACT|nr:polysaccharide biosynthesis/export family protein [Pelagicoccus albus]MBC2606281.1 polysaccharide biosynthesis/export family protein [Pelagicoccus albus]
MKSKPLIKLLSFSLLLLLCGKAIAQSGDENYQLKPGDTIAMRIFQEPDMALESRISADGSVQFPLIGLIKVGGKTLPDLQSELYALYDADYFVNPQVSIQITEYAQRRVRVRGKVNRPGFVVIPPEEEFTLIDVITAAGDIAAGGNEKRIELHRRSAKGDTKVTVIDLSQKDDQNQAANLIMQNNDVVIIPEKLF